MRRILLLFIFLSILTFQTLNIRFYAGIENRDSVAINPSDSVIEGEINHNDNREVYRDGIVDPFDNFTSTGFPTEHKEN